MNDEVSYIFLQGEFADYKRESYVKLRDSIAQTNTPAVQAVLKSFLDKVYKRQCFRNEVDITNLGL